MAQIKYTDLAQKPIGHTIATTTVWRYAIKKEKEKPLYEIETDTSFNTDGSIKRIDTVRLAYMRSSADFDYPDTLIEERKNYNQKGLLVFMEEPYHIHVDQPCTLRVTYEYDEKNRIILQDLFECDTLFHTKRIIRNNDTTKQSRISVIEYETESYYFLRKFDKKNRLIENKYYLHKDTSENYLTKLTYLKHGRIVKRDNYENGKQDDTYYTYYNRHGKKIKDIIVSNLPADDSLLLGDTIITKAEYFYYDKKGNLLREEKYSKRPDVLVETHTYEYDAQNNLIYEQEKNKEYKRDIIRKYFYRTDGLTDYYDVFDEDKTITRYKYEYTFYK
ncbi:MAG TPA: hypothetical protein VN698_03895 [Bacteroidia bacterium]|nr:hypothetical protein [Bacteroidia bacterium]